MKNQIISIPKIREKNRQYKASSLLSLILFFIFFTSVGSSPIIAQDSGGLKKEKTNPVSAIIEENKKKLSENKNHPEFFSLLKETVTSISDISEAISLLSDNVRFLQSAEEKFDTLYLLAEYEEMSGRIEAAQKHYQLASSFEKSHAGHTSLYHSARLLYEMGEDERAFQQFDSLLAPGNSLETSLKIKSMLMSVMIFIKNGELEKAKKICTVISQVYSQSLDAQTAYMLILAAENCNLPEVERMSKNIIKNDFPRSTEYSLIFGGPVQKKPAPSSFLTQNQLDNLQPEKPAVNSDYAGEAETGEATVMIQTGSYLQRENAKDMVRKLMDKGFEAVIIETKLNGTVYHKVVIQNIPKSESQEHLIRLKDEGIEGFFLY